MEESSFRELTFRFPKNWFRIFTWKTLEYFAEFSSHELTFTAWKVPKYGVFYWSECRKRRTRKDSVFGTFHVVVAKLSTLDVCWAPRNTSGYWSDNCIKFGNFRFVYHLTFLRHPIEQPWLSCLQERSQCFHLLRLFHYPSLFDKAKKSILKALIW